MRKVLFMLAMLIVICPVKAYDFSAVAPSGQTLFYNIIGDNAEVTYQTLSSWGISTYANLQGGLIIPDGVYYDGVYYNVTSIGDFAFRSCDGITSVSIPNSVLNIGIWAFNNCTNLATISIGDSVTSIGGQAFSGCSSLVSIIVPDDVVTLGACAFQQCGNLETITFGEHIEQIDIYAFHYCPNLDTIFFRSINCPTINQQAFDPYFNPSAVYIPCGSYSSYHSVRYWNYIEPIANISLSMTVNDTSYGMVSCIQIPPMYTNVRCDSTAVIQATPNYGYHFDR